MDNIPVTIACHPDGSYGIALGHDHKNPCPDEDDDEYVISGIGQTRLHGEITYYKVGCSQRAIDILEKLSQNYEKNKKCQKRYHNVCIYILRRAGVILHSGA